MQIKDANMNHARVFFALWPETGTQKALHLLAEEFRGSCGGRVMRADTLHMTLLFLGAVERAKLPELIRAAERVRASPMTIALDRLDCWKHNRIVYAAPSVSVMTLDRLVQSLRQEVASAGFMFDQHAFKPHVTLLRNCRRVLAIQACPAIVWQVGSFALVESMPTVQGAQYRVLRTWPLKA